MKKLLVLVLLFALALAVLPPATALASDDVDLRTELAATAADPDARGDAEWKQQFNNDGTVKRTRFKVDVKDVSIDGLGTVAALRDGVVIFFAPDSIDIEDGQGVFELDSQDGDAVPQLQEGDEIHVLNSDFVLVLVGFLEEN